jgi:hypothetical protein
MDNAKQATPHNKLIDEIMDCRVPKTEREHAAAREIEMLREALRLPLQSYESVAWMTRFDDPERGSYGKPATTHLTQDEAERQAQRHIQKRLCKLRIEPLYAATPRREWVGLTEDEILAIGQELGLRCKLAGNPNIDFDYARAIEAKLKEKNT